MSYILSVRYYPIKKDGRISCEPKTFVRFYTDLVFVWRKLRYFKRFTRVIDYHVEERPAKV